MSKQRYAAHIFLDPAALNYYRTYALYVTYLGTDNLFLDVFRRYVALRGLFTDVIQVSVHTGLVCHSGGLGLLVNNTAHRTWDARLWCRISNIVDSSLCVK